MQRLLILGFIIVFPLLAMAEIPGFEGTGVKTLRVETKINYFNTKSGEESIWETRIFDFAANRFFYAQYEGTVKPEPDESPFSEMVISPELTTIIFNKGKQVLLNDGRGIAAGDFETYTGFRVSSQYSAADIVNHASAAGIIEASGEQYAFNIGEPFFMPPDNPKPLCFLMDSRHRIIEIYREWNGGFKHEKYRWERLEPLNLDYMAHMKDIVRLNEIDGWMVRTVQEIELDPKIPPGLFDLAHPAGYEIKDTRKLLKAPNIPGLGGGAGGAGSSQKP